MADKDLDAIIPMMPREAAWIFTTPRTARAMDGKEILARVKAWRSENGFDCAGLECTDSVAEAVDLAMEKTKTPPDKARSLIYIGGSTFVVSEAAAYIKKR